MKCNYTYLCQQQATNFMLCNKTRNLALCTIHLSIISIEWFTSNKIVEVSKEEFMVAEILAE